MKFSLLLLVSLMAGQAVFSQETAKAYKVVTIVESIVPGGLGRSRIIENKSEVEIGNFTTERSSGTDS